MAISYEPCVSEDLALGYGTVDVTMPAGGTATGHKIGLHTFIGNHVLNVMDFGAVGDGVTDDTAAIQATIAALGEDGGIVFLPGGSYLTSAPLDMTAGQPVASIGGRVWIKGINPGTSKILPRHDGAAIMAANYLSVFNHISDLSIIGAGDGTVNVPGQYGITTDDSTGSGLIVNNVQIANLGDAAIRIGGPTGPTVIQDVQIVYIAGYGIELVAVGGVHPQDVSIVRGSIQGSFGGIYANYSMGLHVSDTDIELGATALYPAIYLISACYGVTFTDVTASIGGSGECTPNAVVALTGNAAGVTWVGGIVATNHETMDCVLINGAGVLHNSFIGGLYSGKGTVTSGYPFRLTAGQGLKVVNPHLANFEATKRLIYDDGIVNNQKVVAIGIPTRAYAETDEYSVGLPSVYMADPHFVGPTRSTVGAAGGASALPATPLGYIDGYVGAVPVLFPYYARP